MTERTILDMALEALRPIAAWAKTHAKCVCSDDTRASVDSELTIGDLRRAAAAAAAIEKMKGDADARK